MMTLQDNVGVIGRSAAENMREDHEQAVGVVAVSAVETDEGRGFAVHVSLGKGIAKLLLTLFMVSFWHGDMTIAFKLMGAMAVLVVAAEKCYCVMIYCLFKQKNNENDVMVAWGSMHKYVGEIMATRRVVLTAVECRMT